MVLPVCATWRVGVWRSVAEADPPPQHPTQPCAASPRDSAPPTPKLLLDACEFTRRVGYPGGAPAAEIWWAPGSLHETCQSKWPEDRQHALSNSRAAHLLVRCWERSDISVVGHHRAVSSGHEANRGMRARHRVLALHVWENASMRHLYFECAAESHGTLSSRRGLFTELHTYVASIINIS